MTVTGRTWLAYAFACLLLSVAPAAAAAGAHLDRSFGVKGMASVALGPRDISVPSTEITATPDGGVIARTSIYPSAEIRRYGPTGELLGSENKAEDEIPAQPVEASTPDGGHVVGVSHPEESDEFVSEYRADGSLEESFGTGGTSEGVPFRVEAVAALPSGAILAAGSGVLEEAGPRSAPTYQVYVARFGPDGKVDPAFGAGGIVRLTSDAQVAGSETLLLQGRLGGGAIVVLPSAAVALDSSGKVDAGFGEKGRLALPGTAIDAASAPGESFLVVGTRSRPSVGKDESRAPEALYLARYTPAGRPDPSYGGDGIGIIDPGGKVVAAADLISADGTVLIGGTVARASDCPPGYRCGDTPLVARFTSDGLPDDGFGKEGIVRFSTLAVPVETDHSAGVVALARRPGGGAFVSGKGLGVAFLAALSADGSVDPGFGTGGFVTTESRSRSYARPSGTAVDSRGRIYALLQSDAGTGLGSGTMMVRYSPGGHLDRGFGEDGKAYVPPASEALAVAPDGSSYAISYESSTLVKLTPAGRLDPGFGEEGAVKFFEGRAFEPGAMLALPGGDLLVAGGLTGRVGTSAAVLRYRSDGHLERSFGKGGVAVAKRPPRWTWESSTAMAVEPDGGILLAGGQYRSCCTQSGALVRFDRDGQVDRSFGYRGTRRVGRHIPAFYAVAVRDGHIFAVGTDKLERPDRDLVYEFRADGSLDRRFGDRGVVAVPTRYTGHGNADPEALVPTADRIFLVRSDSREPLIALTAAGERLRASTRRAQSVIPRGTEDARRSGPVAAPDGGALVLAWTENRPGEEPEESSAEVTVERLVLDR